MNYRREVDGLRALAVIPVIFFHADIGLFSGGFVGVDVFFVISGYLITTIILAEVQDGRFSIVRFYERRARRILPALFLVLATCLPFAWFWMVPSALKDFSQSLVAVMAFASNILFVLNDGDYFNASAELKPLLHTWSLAVEEQYYVIFPLTVYFLHKVRPKLLIGAFAFVAMASLWVAHTRQPVDPTGSFYLLHTRAWELLLGAVVACILLDRRAVEAASGPAPATHSDNLRQLSAATGLAMLLSAIFLFDRQTPSPGVYMLLPTVGTALIILCATRETLVGRLLGHPWLVGIGLISYSAYLWHQPLLAIARIRVFDLPVSMSTSVAMACLSIPLAYLSWRFVEAPFRDRSRTTPRQIAVMAVAGTAFFLSVGMAGHVSKGFPTRTFEGDRAVFAFTSYDPDIPYRKGSCFLKASQSFDGFAKNCLVSPSATGSVLVWGDSHAAALASGLHVTSPERTSQFTSGGCPPLVEVVVNGSPHCNEINRRVLKLIGEVKPSTVLLHANWRRLDQARLSSQLGQTIERIRAASVDTQIVVVGGVPQWEPSLPIALIQQKVSLASDTRIDTPLVPEIREIDSRVREGSKRDSARFHSALALLCEESSCLGMVADGTNAVPLIWDYGHLTHQGAARLVELLGMKSPP